MANKDRYEIQIIYTQIDRDRNNNPVFHTYYFNVDSNRYFYPASTVKLPLVLLAFEKLKYLSEKGIDKFTPVFHDSAYSGQLSVSKDTTSETGLPSIAHYAKKILVVSDNDAYNRLYEFLGQKEVNRRLRGLGYNMRVLHRLERPLSQDENRHTEAVRFVKDDAVIFDQPMLVNDEPIVVKERVLKGKGFIRNDSLVSQPFDFTYKNFFPLTAQHKMLQALLFPETVDEKFRFDIYDEDRVFVLKYMSQLPTETIFPSYGKDTTYHDAYCKFFMYGAGRSSIPDNIRIFNKIGDAYGYLVDNAYIVDFKNSVEFMLSAVINTDTDSIYNDGNYDYETLGYPFMKNIGQLIYNYELKRKRDIKPDLSPFVFTYDQQKKRD
ncbi:serine hydrolase [Fulvivirgaceae bacterium PWU20]|uniref:Serine hydrolase n=1 Tax=Chryseosolibacter indicus TaxID=2782351 RepID=A0ABS5VUK6_9BACT|nr:serine hydrolase [Chryseosolibacter indicus]